MPPGGARYNVQSILTGEVYIYIYTSYKVVYWDIDNACWYLSNIHIAFIPGGWAGGATQIIPPLQSVTRFVPGYAHDRGFCFSRSVSIWIIVIHGEFEYRVGRWNYTKRGGEGDFCRILVGFRMKFLMVRIWEEKINVIFIWIVGIWIWEDYGKEKWLFEGF